MTLVVDSASYGDAVFSTGTTSADCSCAATTRTDAGSGAGFGVDATAFAGGSASSGEDARLPAAFRIRWVACADCSQPGPAKGASLAASSATSPYLWVTSFSKQRKTALSKSPGKSGRKSRRGRGS